MTIVAPIEGSDITKRVGSPVARATSTSTGSVILPLLPDEERVPVDRDVAVGALTEIHEVRERHIVG